MPETASIAELMDSFRRIVQALRSSHRAATDLDLTGAQLFVLHALHEAGVALSVSELASLTRTDPSTVSAVAGRLVERGLVQRVRAIEDNRRVELSITRKGRALRRRAPRTVAQKRLIAALERLSDRDAATLSRLLAVIVEAMGEADAPAAMLFDEQAQKMRDRK